VITLFGRKAFEYLVISLWDQDKWVRIAAADALADSKDARSYRFLVTLMDDSDNDVRFAAAVSLGKLGDPRAFGPLMSACSDRNYYVRQGAKFSLESLCLKGETGTNDQGNRSEDDRPDPMGISMTASPRASW
jgi:HEAT repeat protein